MNPERKLHLRVCQHLKLFYPNVYFDSDPSGLYVSGMLSTLLQKTRSDHSHLDITLLEPSIDKRWPALIIELKDKTIFKKDGELKSSPYYDKQGNKIGDHLQDQDETKKHLEARGFKVDVAWEFEEVERILIDYLGKPIEPPDEFFDKYNI